MKTQIKFQKTLALITLIVAAVAFAFSLCFFSGNLSDVMSYRLSLYNETYSGRIEIDGITQVIRDVPTADYLSPANDWVLLAQSLLGTIVTLGIIFFVVIAFVYITCTHSRRNYYVSNYVMTGIIVLYAAALAIFGLISMVVLMGQFMSLTFTYDSVEFMVLNNNIKLPEVSYSPLMFILGMIVYFLVLCVALAWVYNLLWKKKLMSGEKQLLSGAVSQEVA